MVPGLDFSVSPPVLTGTIPGGPAMFVLNPSAGPVEFYRSIYNSDPTYLQSFLILQKLYTELNNNPNSCRKIGGAKVNDVQIW